MNHRHVARVGGRDADLSDAACSRCATIIRTRGKTTEYLPVWSDEWLQATSSSEHGAQHCGWTPPDWQRPRPGRPGNATTVRLRR